MSNLSQMEAKKPVCKICESGNKKYSVVEPTFGTTTLMGISPAYWDEDGKYHEQLNPNHTTFEFICSNGHKWTEVK